MVNLMFGDCLKEMKKIPDKSVDMVLCDLPYGTSACKWDNVIPFEPLWKEYERIAKENAAIVLFGSQPFTSKLICSNLKLFKYEIVWDKVNQYTGALLAKKRPLKRHENILVFYKRQPIYNPQYEEGKPYRQVRNYNGVGEYASNTVKRVTTNNTGYRYPCSVIKIKGMLPDGGRTSVHPTQKPVALLEYLIKTYTNPGETVLDNCMGSGSTGVACVNTGRDFIGIELDQHYFEVAKQRIEGAGAQMRMEVAI